MSQGTYTVTDSNAVARTTDDYTAATEECAWWAEKMADRMVDGYIEVRQGETLLHKVEIRKGVIVTRSFPKGAVAA